MKQVLLFAICGLLAFFTHAQVLQTALPATEKFSEERLKRIDKLIQQGVDSGWTAGGTALIARDGKIIYQKAFGYADLATKKPMQTDAIFRIASQTKAITSVAAMTLFEEGKFLLDDPISKYIPAFANARVLDKFNEADSSYTTVEAKREVTIRDLFTHTSGVDYAVIGSPQMRAIYAKAKLSPLFGNDTMILANMVNKLAAMPLVHQPGEAWTYGLNVDILGYLIEVLSGRTLDQFFKERLFIPMGMTDTYFYLPKEKWSRLTTVYTIDSLNKLTPMLAPPGVAVGADFPLLKGTYYAGGAGLVSTTKDYGAFLQMLLNNGVYNGKRILARHTVELMTSNQIGDLNLGDNKFGLGFEITTKKGAAKLGVSEGSFAWGGYFTTTYWADPKERLVGEIYFQQNPLKHGELFDKFKALVYQAIND